VSESGAREGEAAGHLLELRLAGPPELVDQAVEALHVVFDVVEVSGRSANRRAGGARRYVRASGLREEAQEFLRRAREREAREGR